MIKKLFLSLLMIAFVSIAVGQEGERADEMRLRFEKLKADLELNETQAEEVKALFKERRKQLTKLKAETKPKEDVALSTQEEDKAVKLKAVKRRQEINDRFRQSLAEILTTKQMEKFDKAFIQQREEKKARREHQRQHEEGEEHEHEDEQNKDHKHGEPHQQTLTPGK